MAYCTQTDLQDQIPSATLIQLTDDAGAGAVVLAVIAKAIADADAEINSYCASRYSVPLSPVPAMILKISVDIAIYNLYARRKGAPDDRKIRYDNAIRFLRDVSKGAVTLGAASPSPANTGDTVSFDGDDRIFTRGKMDGY